MLWQHGKASIALISMPNLRLTVLAHLDINLAELQKTLDQQGLELVENQKESVIGRKALADKTKGKADRK